MGFYYVDNVAKFRLTQCGRAGGDCTAPYDVVLLWENATVGEFIDAVLRAKMDNRCSEWGYIGIDKTGSIFGDPLCEYSHGKIVSDGIPAEIKAKHINWVTAHGGWTRMDYRIYLKD